MRAPARSWPTDEPGELRTACTGPTMTVMSKSRSEVLEESRRKGFKAGAAVAATVVIGVAGAPVTVLVAATVPTAYLGWRWWTHRAKNGIKF